MKLRVPCKLALALTAPAAAQQFGYPAKGQSPQQQQATSQQQQAAFSKARAG
jgi:hypothetical protein